MMEEKEYIYIIDDNQFGELTNACQYIETGIYDDVIRWVKPCKETKVEDFKDAACICYHSSLSINDNGKWKSASILLSDLEDMVGDIPLVKYSKGCSLVNFEREFHVVYEMPK